MGLESRQNWLCWPLPDSAALRLLNVPYVEITGNVLGVGPTKRVPEHLRPRLLFLLSVQALASGDAALRKIPGQCHHEWAARASERAGNEPTHAPDARDVSLLALDGCQTALLHHIITLATSSSVQPTNTNPSTSATNFLVHTCPTAAGLKTGNDTNVAPVGLRRIWAKECSS